MAEGAGLENQSTFQEYRGFKSLTLRQKWHKTAVLRLYAIFLYVLQHTRLLRENFLLRHTEIASDDAEPFYLARHFIHHLLLLLLSGNTND